MAARRNPSVDGNSGLRYFELPGGPGPSTPAIGVRWCTSSPSWLVKGGCMGQDNPFSFNWSPSYAPFFAPDTTTITDTSTIMGSNIQEGDGPIERHVLEKVGSYGYQINRIVDV